MAKVKKALILTVFNEEKTINRLINSILDQTEFPDEVIIVDGGSADKTLPNTKYLIRNTKYQNKFKVYTKKGNRSVGRNEAIKHSSAGIIAITDAGCILDKNWFRNITKPFESKNVDVVAGYYKAKTHTIFQKCLVPYVLVMPDRVIPENFLPATRSMAIRKSTWEKTGKFDEKLSNNEDYAFSKKLKSGGFKIKFEKSAIVYWIPRNDIFQTFNMFYRFAKGDIEAKIVRPKVVLIFARYILVLYLLLTAQYYLLILFLILYAFWAIYKNYKYVKKPQAFMLLPIIQLVSDMAVITGSLVGLL